MPSSVADTSRSLIAPYSAWIWMPASRPIGPAHKWQQRQQHEEIGNTRWGAREAASRIKNAITILKNGPARDGDRASLATGSKLRISPWISPFLDQIRSSCCLIFARRSICRSPRFHRFILIHFCEWVIESVIYGDDRWGKGKDRA